VSTACGIATRWVTPQRWSSRSSYQAGVLAGDCQAEDTRRGEAMLKVRQRRTPAAQYETMADLPLVQAVIREDSGAWEALV